VTDVAALADRLSPAQRHVVLRGSDAALWAGPEIGYQAMSRHWWDLVHGRKWAQHRTLVALEWLGVYEPDARLDCFWRLTELGLSVQVELRCRLGKGVW
jgi:hypothetical protein